MLLSHVFCVRVGMFYLPNSPGARPCHIHSSSYPQRLPGTPRMQNEHRMCLSCVLQDQRRRRRHEMSTSSSHLVYSASTSVTSTLLCVPTMTARDAEDVKRAPHVLVSCSPGLAQTPETRNEHLKSSSHIFCICIGMFYSPSSLGARPCHLHPSMYPQ
jgi:hypothetical protein